MSFRANIHTGFLPMKVMNKEVIITDIDGEKYKVPIKADCTVTDSWEK